MNMMRQFFLLIIIIGVSHICNAQSGFQITGKVNDLSDDTLFLTTGEHGELDTLGITQIKNGVFMFTGRVETPVAARIFVDDGRVSIPLILENVPFVINLNERGALIQGGEQQEVFGQFNRINARLLQEQEHIQKEYFQAEKAGDKAKMRALMRQFEEVIASARQDEKLLREKYADMYVTAYVISLGMYGDTEENLKAKYETLGENARNSIPGEKIATTLKQYANLEIGKTAPDFTVKKTDGNSFTFYEIPAKLKLLHFWISSNESCRRMTPELLKLYLQYCPMGFEIISFSLDENIAHWRHAVGMDGMTWTNGSDLKGFDSPVVHEYLVNTLPYTILVDAENRIVAKGLLGNDLRKKVAELLKKKK